MTDGEETEVGGSGFDRRRFLRAAASAGVVSTAGLSASDTVGAQSNGGGEEVWRFETGDEVHSSPTVVDGTVYFGSDDGNLYAVEASSGEEVWNFETGDDVDLSPTVVDGTVYVGSNDNNLYAVEASSGEEVWSFETGNGVTSSPTVVDDTVYVGSSDNNLYAVDASSGDEVWTFETGDGVWFSSPTVVDGTVYVGSLDNNLYAVDASSGEQIWSFQTGDSVGLSPTVVDGTVYFGSYDDNLYAVDASTGEGLWSFETGDGVFSSPTVVDGTVYVGSTDHNLYAVDAGVSGSSEDSRVLLGTLGHHNDLRAGEMLSMSELGGTGGPSEDGNGGDGPQSDSAQSDGTQTDSTDDSTDGTDSSQTDSTQTDGMPMTVIAGGAVGLLSVVYGGYRLLGSGKSEKETEEPTEPRTTDTRKTTTDRRTTETEDSLDETLRDVRSRIDQARNALSSAKFETALAHAERATDEAKEARGPAKRVDRTDEVEELFQEARDIRDEVSEKKEAYEEMESEIGKARRKLDRAEDRVENAPETALDKVDETAGSLDRIRRNAEEYGYLQQEVKNLEERCESLRQRAEKEVQTSKKEEFRSPKKLPPVPNISIKYTEIEDKEPVGSGGNADVYKTEYEGETIALKEPRLQGTLHKDVAERFMNEAETWDRLDDHENIVSVIDYGSEPLPWIAMEYMDGGDLDENAGGMEFEQKVWTSTQVVEAIHHAHTRGIVHLDLKPENILFRKTDDDHYDVPKVADWGLAKMLLEHSKSIEGMSPHYAAPEQFNSDDYGEPDNATDVYQLGAVFYEMFTGEPVFEGQPSEVMFSVLNDEVTLPSEVNQKLPEELDDVLLKALSKDKSERHETVLYLRDDLRELLE